MRILRFILPLLLLLLNVSAQSPQNIKRVTIAQLPAASENNGKSYVVTDASTYADCTVGSGSIKHECYSDGTNWLSTTADFVPKTTQIASNALNGDISTATLKSSLSLNSVENTALSTWAGTTNITTLGTIASGTWNATAIGITKGGTGQTTAAAGFNALAPSKTGNSLKVLRVNAGETDYELAAAGSGVTNVATTSPITGGPITSTGTIACATCATTTNGGALSGTSPVAVSAAGAISCTTCLVSSTPVTVGQGGTGTASTLTGLVRGSASAMTAAELSGDVTTSGSNATTIAAAVVSRSKVDSTVNGIGVVSTASVNGVAATDTQLLELTLPAGYLNRSSGIVDVKGSGTWTTGTTQTPTQNFKVKLCTVSGCGSGTVLTLLTWTSAASTASTTQTWIFIGTVGTVSTGASGTLIAHGFADLPVGASANVAFAGFHDVNTAATAGIDLTAQLFLNLMWNPSTQSGTKNSAIGHMFSVKSRD